jgi:hypothetical protein
MYYNKTIELNQAPSVNLCINKSRLKIYNKNNYYLKDGTEFSIELFNPLRESILCKIYLNGKSISYSGLVLKPGQRVFLERFIDSPKKFLFETYEVDNNSTTKNAIAENGDLSVEFYLESKPIVDKWYSYSSYIDLSNYNSGTPFNLYNSNIGTGSLNSGSYGSVVSTNYCSNVNSNKIETGRIEEGSNSNQKFVSSNQSFDILPFNLQSFKLLPLESKFVTLKDTFVKQYCVNCGHKLKHTYKFCPSCSTKV